MIKKKLKIFLVFLLFFSGIIARAQQVSVVSVQLTSFNITPESMLSATIMNTGAATQVEIISTLYNVNNEILFTVKSLPFILKSGLSAPFDGSRKIASVDYSSNNQASYIKTTRGLPSGTFKICVEVIYTNNSEVADQFCDEIVSEFNEYLYLISPANEDSIETTTPLLIWTHSEPFNVLSSGEYFRMVVCDLNANQSTEVAINTNSPLMVKNYLTTHSLQYPYDAKQLEKGKRYAWQVQKISNGIIINKTEAWEFSIILERPVPDYKYAALKKILDAGYYTAENNKIFFKFEEEYSSGDISGTIYNSKREVMLPKVQNEGTKSILNFKQNGDNRYEIDLEDLNLKKGFYTLETKNKKGELFLLKFYSK